MGRKNRKNILYDGCYAHIFSRASEKRRIFCSSEDFDQFKELLLKSKDRFSYHIHHYCLMHTHFHLAVSMENAQEFSEGLKWVKWSYARFFNFRKKRFGPLWRDRFKSLLIEDERYLLACGRYIESNPVEAGMVNRCEDWSYSSSGYYLKGKKDLLVSPYVLKGMPVISDENLEKYFTQGYAIGSELFKIQCQEKSFSIMPVPL